MSRTTRTNIPEPVLDLVVDFPCSTTMFVGILAKDESLIAAIPLAGLVTVPEHVAHAIARAIEYAEHYTRVGDPVYRVVVSTGDTGDGDTEYGTLYESAGDVVIVDARRGDGDPTREGTYGPWPSEPDGTPYKFY